jgi:hypothetical protein
MFLPATFLAEKPILHQLSPVSHIRGSFVMDVAIKYRSQIVARLFRGLVRHSGPMAVILSDDRYSVACRGLPLLHLSRTSSKRTSS